jgi:hypothetical protein
VEAVPVLVADLRYDLRLGDCRHQASPPSR